MKGQVSAELLVIIGVILLLFIPILITVYVKANEANLRLISLQSMIAQSRLASTVNSIGYLGHGATSLAEIYLSGDVEQIEFSPLGNGGEIVFSIREGGEISEIAESVKFQLPAASISNVHPGLYRFRITNEAGSVLVEKLE